MAVRFDAANDRYTASNGAPGGATYSGVVWVYLVTDRNSDTTILMLAPASTSANAWYLGTSTDGQSCYMADTGASPGGFPLPLAGWAKIGFVVAGTSVSFYAANLANSLTKYTGTSTATAITPTQLYLGSDAFGSWFNGRLAGFKMWNAALSDAEIAAEFTQFQPVRSTSLLRFHRFASAGTADDSGLGRSLTAGSSATTTEADPPGVPEVAARPVSGTSTLGIGGQGLARKSPSSVLNIGAGPDQNHFALQYARPGDSAIITKSLADLASGFFEVPWFYTTSDDQRVHFEARCDAPTTSGSNTSRAELREVNADGTNASWNATTGEHVFLIDTTITALPTGKPEGVVAQIFGETASADIMSIRTQQVSATTRLRARIDGVSVTSPQLASPYVTGTRFRCKLRLTATAREVYYAFGTDPLPATPQITAAATTETSAYAKGGIYNQATAAEGGTSAGAVEMSSISITHSVGPTPETGAGSLGLAGSATPVKIAKVSGRCALGLSAAASGRKRTPQTGAAAGGLAASTIPRKSAAGAARAAIGLGAGSTGRKVAAPTGRATAALATSSSARKVAPMPGATSIGIAATGAARKVTAQRGLAASVMAGQASARKVGTPTGTGPLAVTTSGLPRKVSAQAGVSAAALNAAGQATAVPAAAGSGRGVAGLASSVRTVKVASVAGVCALGLGSAGRVGKIVGTGGAAALGSSATTQPRKATGQAGLVAVGLTGSRSGTAVRAQAGTSRLGMAASARGARVSSQGGAAGLGVQPAGAGGKVTPTAGRLAVSVSGSAASGKLVGQSGTGTLGFSGQRSGTASRAQSGTCTVGAAASVRVAKLAAARGRAGLPMAGSGTARKTTAVQGVGAAGVGGYQSATPSRSVRASCPLGFSGVGRAGKAATPLGIGGLGATATADHQKSASAGGASTIGLGAAHAGPRSRSLAGYCAMSLGARAGYVTARVTAGAATLGSSSTSTSGKAVSLGGSAELCLVGVCAETSPPPAPDYTPPLHAGQPSYAGSRLHAGPVVKA